MTDRERAEKWANTYPDSEFDPQVVEDDLVADFAAVRADEREQIGKVIVADPSICASCAAYAEQDIRARGDSDE